jgi:hypothetical protein
MDCFKGSGKWGLVGASDFDANAVQYPVQINIGLTRSKTPACVSKTSKRAGRERALARIAVRLVSAGA